jgi:signal transduction histidine kinase
VPAKLSSLLLGRLPAPVEATAYFVVAEALANAARHSGASAVYVQVERTEDGVAAEVADDGRGGADPALGSGLQGIADRVGAMSGRLEVVSPAGGGTAVRVFLPAPLSAS